MDYNCDGVVEYTDADGDGVAACEDCDDGDAAIQPSADEVCDGVDNNCDGEVDEASAVDALTFYADLDADGFGDVENTIAACAAPSGYTTDASDCDDSAATIYPGADEVCDGADSDCDGVVAEGLVPTDYSGVQAAVDAGAEWVCLEAGTYTENVAIELGAALVLEGVGSDQVFLDGGAAGRTLDVDASDFNFTLAGLTIQGGAATDTYAGGLYVYGSGANSVYITDVVFTGNDCTASSCYGAAASLVSYDHADFTDVEITGNTLNGVGQGSLFINEGQSLNLDGVEVHDEVMVTNNTGAGLASAVFVLNSSMDSTTGLYDSVVTVNDLHVYDNSAETGGTLYSQATFYLLGALDMSNSSFTGNEMTTEGFCVTPSVFSFDVVEGAYRNIEIVGNRCDAVDDVYTSGFWHYGVGGSSTSSATVENMIVAGNTVSAGDRLWSGAVFEYQTTISYTNVSVHGNSAAGASGYGGWLLYRDAQVSLNNVDYSGNVFSVTNDSSTVATGFAAYDEDSALTATTSNLTDLGDTPYSANLTDPTGLDGNLSVDPGYADVSDADPLNWDLTLGSGSALIDAGDASLTDADGSVSDIGAYGGPFGADW